MGLIVSKVAGAIIGGKLGDMADNRGLCVVVQS